jgi:hypothetical protein
MRSTVSNPLLTMGSRITPMDTHTGLNNILQRGQRVDVDGGEMAFHHPPSPGRGDSGCLSRCALVTSLLVPSCESSLCASWGLLLYTEV